MKRDECRWMEKEMDGDGDGQRWIVGSSSCIDDMSFIWGLQNNHHTRTGEQSKVVTLIKWQLASVLGERECATKRNLMMMDCRGTCSRMSCRPSAECTVPLSGQVRDALRRRVYLQPSGRLRVVLCESRVGPFYYGQIWFTRELAWSVVAKWGMILVLVLMLRPNNGIMLSHFVSLQQNSKLELCMELYYNAKLQKKSCELCAGNKLNASNENPKTNSSKCTIHAIKLLTCGKEERMDGN